MKNDKLLHVNSSFLLLIFVLFLSLSLAATQLNGWSSYQWWNVSNNITGIAFNTMPIPVRVNTAALIGNGSLQANCNDWRFTNSTNDTLPMEYESGCNTTSTLFWTNQNLTAGISNTSGFGWYRNPQAANVSLGASVFNSSNGLLFVYHSKNLINESDSTGRHSINLYNTNNLALINTTNLFGSALNITLSWGGIHQRTGGRVCVDDSQGDFIQKNFTIDGWVNISACSTPGGAVVVSCNIFAKTINYSVGGAANPQDWHFAYNVVTASGGQPNVNLSFMATATDGTTILTSTANFSVNDVLMHHVGMTYQNDSSAAANVIFYFDGQPKGTFNNTNAPPQALYTRNATLDAMIGHQINYVSGAGGDPNFDCDEFNTNDSLLGHNGVIDELRFWNTIKDTNYFNFTYQTQWLGNSSYFSGEQNLTDTLAPNVGIITPTSGSNYSTSVFINMSVNDSGGNGVSYVQTRLENATANVTPWTNASMALGNNGTGFWNVTLITSSVANGTYNLTVNASDGANSNKTVNVSIVIDNNAPLVAVITPAAGTTNLTTPIAVNISANASNGIQLVQVQLANTTTNVTPWTSASLGNGNINNGFWNVTFYMGSTFGAYNISVNATSFASVKNVSTNSSMNIMLQTNVSNFSQTTAVPLVNGLANFSALTDLNGSGFINGTRTDLFSDRTGSLFLSNVTSGTSVNFVNDTTSTTWQGVGNARYNITIQTTAPTSGKGFNNTQNTTYMLWFTFASGRIDSNITFDTFTNLTYTANRNLTNVRFIFSNESLTCLVSCTIDYPTWPNATNNTAESTVYAAQNVTNSTISKPSWATGSHTLAMRLNLNRTYNETINESLQFFASLTTSPNATYECTNQTAGGCNASNSPEWNLVSSTISGQLISISNTTVFKNHSYIITFDVPPSSGPGGSGSGSGSSSSGAGAGTGTFGTAVSVPPQTLLFITPRNISDSIPYGTSKTYALTINNTSPKIWDLRISSSAPWVAPLQPNITLSGSIAYTNIRINALDERLATITVQAYSDGVLLTTFLIPISIEITAQKAPPSQTLEQLTRENVVFFILSIIFAAIIGLLFYFGSKRNPQYSKLAILGFIIVAGLAVWLVYAVLK